MATENTWGNLAGQIATAASSAFAFLKITALASTGIAGVLCSAAYFMQKCDYLVTLFCAIRNNWIDKSSLVNGSIVETFLPALALRFSTQTDSVITTTKHCDSQLWTLFPCTPSCSDRVTRVRVEM